MPRPRNDRVSLDALRKILAYVPETGQFFYRVSRGQKRAGELAGRKSERGYVVIPISGINILAHRLAVAFTAGVWPERVVDHINGNPTDNRIANLRATSQSMNVASAYMRKMKRTGMLGIRFKLGAWEASIKHHGQDQYLGRFKSQELAQGAYLDAATRLRGTAIFEQGTVEPPCDEVSGAQFITAKEPKVALTRERLREIVHYDPKTGIFVRKRSFRYRGRESWRQIGIACHEGYLRAKIDGRSYMLHRLAWLYMTGEWPPAEVHHLNHAPGDNRWTNLQAVSALENNHLRRRSGPIPKMLRVAG